MPIFVIAGLLDTTMPHSDVTLRSTDVSDMIKQLLWQVTDYITSQKIVASELRGSAAVVG